MNSSAVRKPNWNAAVNIAAPTANAKYTAPSDGWFYSNIVANNYSTCLLNVNGVDRNISHTTGQDADRDSNSVCVFLASGTVVYWGNKFRSDRGSLFVPCV